MVFYDVYYSQEVESKQVVLINNITKGSAADAEVQNPGKGQGHSLEKTDSLTFNAKSKTTKGSAANAEVQNPGKG